MKRGFTLIELLAVILILGIIALIAVPQVTNVIENASKGAAETSAKHYVDAVTNRLSLNRLDKDSTNDIKDGEIDVEEFEVDISGEKPTSGRVVVENGKILSADLKLNGYTIICNDKGKCIAEKGYFKYFATSGTLSASSTVTDLRPANRRVYVKYSESDTALEHVYYCVYDDIREYCIEYNEYTSVVNRIKEYYEYGDSWPKDPEKQNIRRKPGTDNKISCQLGSTTFKCWNPNVTISTNNTGYIGVIEAGDVFICKRNTDGTTTCYFKTS